ncbi:hypothetical protein B0H12DRAFT_1127843 [Mycena haematopus]|nr:hypothetical protein B0H12DRAFT_1127843 [Mycena haematopus]
MRPHFSYSHGFHSWHGPRRAVWFIIGAASASFWHHHKEAHHHTHERYFGHCFRPPVHYRPSDPNSPTPAHPEPPQWRPRDIPSTINNMPPASLPWGYPDRTRTAKALDSIMSSMESLKAKLAEHRALREAAQRQLEKELEEQRNRPHRFV